MSEVKPAGAVPPDAAAAAPALPRPVVQQACAFAPGAQLAPELKGKVARLELSNVQAGTHLEGVNLTRYPRGALGDAQLCFTLSLVGLDEATRCARVLISEGEAKSFGIRAGDLLRLRAADVQGNVSYPVDVVLAPDDQLPVGKRELGRSAEQLPARPPPDGFPTVAASSATRPKLAPDPGTLASGQGPATEQGGVLEWK